MLESHLEKGSWPSLLQEITFYGNNLDNARGKISLPMFPFDHQPRSPINMLISTGHTPTKVTGSASQYLETTVKRRQELSKIARENQECTQSGEVHCPLPKVFVHPNNAHTNCINRIYFGSQY